MTRFQQFQEGMSSDEIEEKLKFVREVLPVAKELGKDDTISALLPFLNDWCPDNDDEALTELAKEIYNLKELFSADEMKYVLPILKHLATTEEVVVREAAVDSINRIVESMSPRVVCDEMINVIEELYRDEWFTPRVSSASLIANVYSKVSLLSATEDTSEPLKILREHFFALCKDDTPMVRRAAAKNMSSMFAVFADDQVSSFVSQFDEYYCGDDEATKLTLMSFTKELLIRVTDDADRSRVINIFQNCMEARSYKVREAAALEVSAIAANLGSDTFLKLLLDPYLALLKDNNTEVRKNAVKQMTGLSQCLSSDVFLQKLYPYLPSLATESNAVIAEQIAGVIVDLSKSFPEKMTSLYDLLLASPAPQVRLLLLRRLDEVSLNENMVRRVVLDEGLDGPDWRVREEVAKHMAILLSSTTGTAQQPKLVEIYLHLFIDSVSKVRETCRGSLEKVVDILGADFCFTNVLSKLQKKYTETTNYLLQFNILYTFQVIIKKLPSDPRSAPLVATIIAELNNSVPNLRFISCRILGDLGSVLTNEVKQTVIVKLTALQEDEDRDVRYYAMKSLSTLRAL